MSNVVSVKFGEVLIITELFQKMSKYSLQVSTFRTIEQLLEKLLPVRKSIELKRNQILDEFADNTRYYKREAVDQEYIQITEEEYNELDVDEVIDPKSKIQMKGIVKKELQDEAADKFNDFLNSDLQIEIIKPFDETAFDDVKVSWEDFYVLKKFM